MITIRSQIHSLGDTATAVQYVYLQQEFGDQLISTPQTSPNKPKQTRGLLSYGGAFNVCRLMQCAVRCVPCSYPFLPRSFSPTALHPPPPSPQYKCNDKPEDPPRCALPGHFSRRERCNLHGWSPDHRRPHHSLPANGSSIAIMSPS